MAVQIQFRRDSAANWASNDPTPAEGEVCIETDNLTGSGGDIQFKIGDGSRAYSALPYFAASTFAGILALAKGGTHADLSGTGPGYLKQATTGANVTVGAIAAGDLPNHSAALLTSGTLPLARLANITTAEISATAGILGSQLSATAAIVSGQITSLAASKLSGQVALANGGTGVDLTGTGGATKVLALDGSNVVSARDLVAADIPNLAASKITTGQLALARGGTNADLSATGGPNQVLKQSSAGAAITVGTLAAADIPNLDASKITSGTLALARGGTNADLSATGPGVVYQATAGAAFSVGSTVPSWLANMTHPPVRYQYLNVGSGTTDVSGPASGKRWFLNKIYAKNNTAGTLTYVFGLKRSGSYYITSPVASLTTVTAAAANNQLPVLENGDTFYFATSGAGLDLFFEFIEVPTSSPLKSSVVLALTSGNNTIVTCLANKWLKTLPTAGALSIGDANNNSWGYCNNSGGTRTVYVNLVKSGDSVVAPGTASNSLNIAASSIADKGVFQTTVTALNFLIPGDYVNINTNSSTAGQVGWLNYLEFSY